MIPRLIYPGLKENIKNNKVLLIKGPRKVGKRTLVKQALEELNFAYSEFDASKKVDKKLFEIITRESLSRVFEGRKYILINEAQYIENLQAIIEKLLTDEIEATLILCCSYEPVMDEVLREVLQLQGLEITLTPPCFYETAQHFTLPEEEKLLEKRLIYGSYPQVIEDLDHAEPLLREMIQEVIFTNLGVQERINKADKLLRMLQIISFNIGEPVSYNEIGEKCDLDNETVERYIDLLEKSNILIRIPSFYNGHRYELKKTHVIYFVDCGIRNAIISNFNPLFLRNDIDQLWRNWLISERLKWNKINGKMPLYKFWRTHTKQQMDFIELNGNHASAFKTSWEKKKKVKMPQSFIENYAEIGTHVLNRSTYWGFLTKK